MFNVSKKYLEVPTCVNYIKINNLENVTRCIVGQVMFKNHRFKFYHLNEKTQITFLK